MNTMIPAVRPFDQSTREQMRDAGPVVQRYRARFALSDWSAIDPPRKREPGYPGHPKSTYLKAALVRISEHHLTTPGFRAYLLEHPLLVLELGFRPHVDLRQPYAFNVAKIVPSIRNFPRDAQRAPGKAPPSPSRRPEAQICALLWQLTPASWGPGVR